MPKVSVVIPTANRPELLKRAIGSVLAQDFTDFELIVVDDGDDASSVAKSFSDPRIRYVKNSTKKGGAGSRNGGAQSAKGEFIAFLDDDDQWVSGKLSKQVSLLEGASPKTAFSFTAVKNVYDDKEEVTHVPAGEMNFLERALRRFSGFLTSTLVVRREALLGEGGFDESFPSHQEPDLIIRLSKKYDGIGIDEPLTLMSMSRSYEHISSNLERRIAGRKALLAKHTGLFAQRPRVLARHYFRIALWERDNKNFAEAEKYFRLALRTSLNLRYLAHYVRARFRKIF
jgi:glycosyltransferase involved in cell wall biosynthesis